MCNINAQRLSLESFVSEEKSPVIKSLAKLSHGCAAKPSAHSHHNYPLLHDLKWFENEVGCQKRKIPLLLGVIVSYRLIPYVVIGKFPPM